MVEQAASYQRDRVLFGVILIIISTICTASQDATFKFASSDMTLWQIFAVRSAFLIACLFIIAVFLGTGRAVITSSLKAWPLLRALMFLLMYLSMFSVIPFLDLAVVAAGLYTGPLWVALLSPLLLKERVTPRSAGAIVLGFIGVLVNLRPGTEAFDWAILLPVLAGAFYALSAIITRSKCRDDLPIALSMSLAIVLFVTGVLGSALIIGFQPSESTTVVSPFLFADWSPMGNREWLVIALLTFVVVVNSVVLPTAYQAAPTVIIATFDYFYLIWSPLIGYFLFAEVPDIYTVAAMIIIFAAGLLILRPPSEG